MSLQKLYWCLCWLCILQLDWIYVLELKEFPFWNYLEFSENTMLFESRDHLTSSFITWILSLAQLLCLGLQIPHWVESINQAPLFLILDEKCSVSVDILRLTASFLSGTPQRVITSRTLSLIAWLWLFRVPTWSCLHSDIVHVSCIVLALKKLIMLKFLSLKA